jgi:hypothetical protein
MPFSPWQLAQKKEALRPASTARLQRGRISLNRLQALLNYRLCERRRAKIAMKPAARIHARINTPLITSYYAVPPTVSPSIRKVG